MQNITPQTTAAPNIDAFKSPFETGYGAGWAQSSDAMQRLQKKRALDQQDWALRNQEQQMAIDVWKTQVNASVQMKQIAAGRESDAMRFGLEAQKASADMAIERAKLPVMVKNYEVDTLVKQKEIEKIDRELSVAKSLQSDAFSSAKNEFYSRLTGGWESDMDRVNRQQNELIKKQQAEKPIDIVKSTILRKNQQ